MLRHARCQGDGRSRRESARSTRPARWPWCVASEPEPGARCLPRAGPGGRRAGLRRRRLARGGQGLACWDAVSWLDVSWADAAWSLVSWSDVSWSRRVLERRLLVGCLLGRCLLERRLLGGRDRQRLRRRRASSRLLAQALQQPQRPLVPRHAVGDPGPARGGRGSRGTSRRSRRAPARSRAAARSRASAAPWPSRR